MNVGAGDHAVAVEHLEQHADHHRQRELLTGSTIANLRGLNPYFGSRTLTLVNTRRFVPTNQGDGVDLNFIPSILIDHVDSVTGGASAAYGSGAIAGVQNIFLNTKLEGARIDMDYQQSRTQRCEGQARGGGVRSCPSRTTAGTS